MKYPDFYGIDTPNQKDLIAAENTIKQIEKILGLDSINYLSYKGLLSAIGLSEELLCTSCFTGIYPVDIGERRKEVNFNLGQ